jgi:hypothetical protein
MDQHILVFQHFGEGRVLEARLINMDGKFLPRVFPSGPGGNRFLIIDKLPLFQAEGTAKKNLFDKKDADE